MATDWYRAVCDTHKEAIHVFLKPLHRTEYCLISPGMRMHGSQAILGVNFGLFGETISLTRCEIKGM